MTVAVQKALFRTSFDLTQWVNSQPIHVFKRSFIFCSTCYFDEFDMKSSTNLSFIVKLSLNPAKKRDPG